jgi:hypothetical protein
MTDERKRCDTGHFQFALGGDNGAHIRLISGSVQRKYKARSCTFYNRFLHAYGIANFKPSGAHFRPVPPYPVPVSC